MDSRALPIQFFVCKCPILEEDVTNPNIVFPGIFIFPIGLFPTHLRGTKVCYLDEEARSNEV